MATQVGNLEPRGLMHDEVAALMTAWQDAWFSKNPTAIAELATEDYAYVAPNGTTLDRAAILQVVSDPTYALTGGTHTETLVSLIGDGAALVRRRWQGTGTYRGQVFVEDHRCVTICECARGEWRIRYEQCSAIVP